MKTRNHVTIGIMAVLAMLPARCFSQTSETDEVRQIHAPSVKPAEDEKKPEIGDAVKNIIRQTNEFREKEGKRPVKESAKLQESAQYFADYMARTDRYGHKADGEGPGDRARKHGYDYCIILENIAYQYDSQGFTTEGLGSGFFSGWKKSPGHRRNMLDADVGETAVAIARSKQTGHYYAVQMFGRPKSEAIEFKLTNRSGAAIHYRIGEEPHVLEPNYTTTQVCCRPPELTVELAGGTSGTAETATKRPVSGDHFVVVRKEGRLVLQKE